jgi:hypothetical protein
VGGGVVGAIKKYSAETFYPTCLHTNIWEPVFLDVYGAHTVKKG